MNGILLFMVAILAQPGRSVEVATFPDLIDSLQPQLEDFQCLYEGRHYTLDEKMKTAEKLKADGLYIEFSGTFIWKAGGNTFLDSYSRREPSNEVTRETMIITGETVDHYLRNQDEPVGASYLGNVLTTNATRSGSLGLIFLVDVIRRRYREVDLTPSLEESTIDGRPCSILTFRWKVSGDLYERYWIDLRRGGHTFRREYYGENDQLRLRTTIELSRFEVGRTSIWMPVKGTVEDFVSLDGSRNAIFHKESIDKEDLYIIAGTLEFNKHPPASTFTAKYKPETPVNDLQKRLRYEFGQQKTKRLTRAEEEARLREQLSIAEAQKTELLASSPARSRDWSTFSTWIFGAIALIGSAVILIARRR